MDSWEGLFNLKKKTVTKPRIPNVTLNNGKSMPAIGFGTYGPATYAVGSLSVVNAINEGFRYFDCAFAYGNEEEIGAALAEQISKKVVKRKDLFISSKLLTSFHPKEWVEPCIQHSLANLGLTYLDMYLIHFPVAADCSIEDDPLSNAPLETTDTDYLETWEAMEELVFKGLTLSIGVSNFNADQIDRILKHCRIKPAINQVECHPAFNQKPLRDFLKARDILMVAYSPLGQPDETEKLPPFIFDEMAHKLCAPYEKTPAQLALRYLIQLGTVPIPKSNDPNHTKENINVFDFQLTEKVMEKMEIYNTNERLITFSTMTQHHFYPFNAPF